MSKRTIIIISIVVVLLLGIVVWQATRKSKTIGDNKQVGSQQLPDYVLSAEEEQQVKTVVKSFISLYNTYSYGDYGFVTSLGDYQTPNFQDVSIAFKEHLEQTIPEGYSIISEPDESTFAYSYKQAGELTATMEANVTEKPSASDAEVKYRAVANMDFLLIQNRWYANSFEINKK